MLTPSRTTKEIKIMRDSLPIDNPKWLLYNSELRFTAAYNVNPGSLDTTCWRHIYENNLKLFKGDKRPPEPQWNILPLPEPIGGLDRLTTAILVNRGITDPAFIEAPLEEINPEMDGLDEAIDLILRAVSKKVPVTIYGDYDADGVTGTALLTEALSLIGAIVDYYINDRNKGYAMDEHGVKEIASRGTPRLIITVDNGASSHDAISLARRMKMAVIVTDHHEMPETPNANTIIHPKNFGTPLSGVGTAFKLVYKLYQKLGRNDAYSFLDLAAIGTIADVVPLIKENRILSKHGIALLNNSPRLAVSALAKRVNSETIAFKIAPTINALSRMNGNADRAVEFLLEKDPQSVRAMANYLVAQNDRRKKQTESDMRKIEPLINPEDKILIIKSDVHAGIIGLIAGKLKEKYNRPAIVFSENGDYLKGSCRSAKNFDIIAALRKLQGMTESCGGHPMAAGVTIKKSAFSFFRRALLDQAEKVYFPPPTYNVDAEIDVIDIDLIRKIESLEPYGEAFPSPLFLTKCAVGKPQKIGATHLKIVGDIDFVVWDAWGSIKCKDIMLIGKPSINDYDGKMQFLAQGWRPLAS